jgi:hypothetical protein
MNPAKVNRSRLAKLTDLPNIGPACARDLRTLGFETPGQLKGQSGFALYDRLCEITGMRHDPCMLDTFLSVTHFMEGGKPLPWWHFTDERKRALLADPKKSKFAG